MLSIEEAVETQAENAHHKVELLSTPWLFLVRTMLAGAYIGIGVVIMVEAGGPLVAAGNPFAPLVQGMVFGVALTIVVIAGGELATSAMMMLTQGAMRRRISWGKAGVTLLAVLAGNLVGAFLFATLVHLSGVTAPGTAAGENIARMIEHKAHETNVQLLVRGILCNLLVCLGVWCATKLRDEAAKIMAIFACVMVFITSGFEHVVANMTTMSLGLLGDLPGATVLEFARNMLFVGLGNTIGGALLVGAAYAYRATPRLTEPTAAVTAAVTPSDEPAADAPANDAPASDVAATPTDEQADDRDSSATRVPQQATRSEPALR